jgi:hypothetical protein
MKHMTSKIAVIALLLGSNQTIKSTPEQTQLAAKQQKRSVIQKDHKEVFAAAQETEVALDSVLQCHKETREAADKHKETTNQNFDAQLSKLDQAKIKVVTSMAKVEAAIRASKAAMNKKFEAQEKALNATATECEAQKKALQTATLDLQDSLTTAREESDNIQRETNALSSSSDKEMAIITKNAAQKEKTLKEGVLTKFRQLAKLAEERSQNGGFLSRFTRSK